mgnify:FL=1
MAQAIGTVATLTASWATIGSVYFRAGPIRDKKASLRLKHVKHASQSGGYPVVRVRYKATDSTNTEVTSLDSINHSTVVTTAGVAAVEADTPEVSIVALTDSDGTLQYDLVLVVHPGKTGITVQAKQAGDTTNFGTLAAELDEGL